MYDILSPDGIAMFRERIFNSPEAAEKGFEEWKKSFEHQGYYSSNGGRIPLEKLRSHCELITL